VDVANAMMIGNIGVRDAPEAAFASFAPSTECELSAGSGYASKRAAERLSWSELTLEFF